MLAAYTIVAFIFLPWIFLPQFVSDEQLSDLARFVWSAARLIGDSGSLQTLMAKSWIALSRKTKGTQHICGGPYLLGASVKGVVQYVESQAPIWETSLESTKRVKRQDELAQHLAHSCLIAQSFDSIGLNKICYTRLT